MRDDVRERIELERRGLDKRLNDYKTVLPFTAVLRYTSSEEKFLRNSVKVYSMYGVCQ